MEFKKLREQVMETVQMAYKAGLIRISAGNISLRDEQNRMVITPSGLKYSRMKPDDMVVIDMDGKILSGKPGYLPSSEYRMHVSVYRQLPEARAVVHTHSDYAMTFSAIGRSIRMVSLELLTAGSVEIPITEYACPGTDRVGENVAAVLKAHPGLKGVLIRNHGLVTWGKDVEAAGDAAYNIEIAAKVYFLALQGGNPEYISAEQLDEMYRNYGMLAE